MNFACPTGFVTDSLPVRDICMRRRGESLSGSYEVESLEWEGWLEPSSTRLALLVVLP